MLNTEELSALDAVVMLAYEAQDLMEGKEDADELPELLEVGEAVITKLYDLAERQEQMLPPDVLTKLLEFVESHAEDLAQSGSLTLEEAEELATACSFLAEAFSIEC